MPSYEVALVVRSALDRPQLKDVVKTACQYIMKEGGLVRKMENLGHRELPHPTRAHGARHHHGNFVCIQFDSSAESLKQIARSYKETKDIVRYGFTKNEIEPTRPCVDGHCLFGELKNPDHDKAAYSRRVMQRFRNKTFSNI